MMDSDNRGLSSPRQFVTALVSSLPKSGENDTPRDLASSKQALLTLHVLFPNELLPALDLLDRGLVTQLQCLAPEAPERDETENADDTTPAGVALRTYCVRSSQQSSSRNASRFRNAAYEHTTYYEIRLEAWSCSCPAFAFSAFPATASTPTVETPAKHLPTGEWLFGGLTRGVDLPVCKHLLACALVEHSSLFSHAIEKRTVSLEEKAGWAAGWGD